MLIKNEVGLKRILGGVQQNLSWETMEPFVRQAEVEWLVPVLGEAFYDEIDSLEGQGEPNILIKKLVSLLTVAVANYALGAALPHLQVVVGDGGLVNSGATGVYKYTYVELKNSCMSKADKALETALVFLEKNFDTEVDGVVVFATWAADDVSPVNGGLYINSATDFTEYFPNLKGSRRMFLTLKNYLSRVQEFELKPKIGDGCYDSLDQGRNDVEKAAMRLAKYYLAYKTVGEALPYLNINEDFNMVAADQYSLAEGKYVMDAARRDALKISVDETADKYLNKLMKYLDENASVTVLAEYFASAEYAMSTSRKSYFRAKNDPGKNYVRI